MAEYTETYTNVLKRWSALCGLQYSDLLTTESDLFEQFANGRLRYIWDYAEWPETIDVSEEVLTDQAFTAGTSISHILGIYEMNPFETTATAFDSYKYRRKQDDVYVYGYEVPSTVYVLYKERYPAFATGTDTIPRRFSEYVARGAYVDWLRAEDDPKADRQEQQLEMLLQRELEILERQEKQAPWNNGYSIYSTPQYG